MTFDGNRLRACRKRLGLNQKELGERAGLSQGAISDLERGIALETGKLLDLARVCGVSPEWLLGKDPRQEGAPLRAIVQSAAVPETKALGVGEEDTAVEKPIIVPEMDTRGGASYGGGLRDYDWQEGDESGDRPVAHWGLPPAYLTRELGLVEGATDVLRVYGDSMEDGTALGLANGDRVIVDRTDTDFRQGGIFAVFDGEGVIIKQVELIRGHNPTRIVCKSRNLRYDPIPLVLEDPVRIIGRIAGRITRL